MPFGTGWVWRQLSNPEAFINLKARGRPVVVLDGFAIKVPCPECGGSGRQPDAAAAAVLFDSWLEQYQPSLGGAIQGADGLY